MVDTAEEELEVTVATMIWSSCSTNHLSRKNNIFFVPYQKDRSNSYPTLLLLLLIPLLDFIEEIQRDIIGTITSILKRN
jgi:hypothetical protein